MSRARFSDAGHGGLTRHVAIQTPHHTALLVVDVQNYTSVPGKGEFSHVDPGNIPEDLRYHFDRLENTTLPAIKRLQDACRTSGVEVMYTVVEALTRDMRDLGLDYKISGIGVPKGSDLAELPPSVARLEDEII